jgi:hypothetical protein
MLLVAISDRHIYYAQEVRFYASMAFFTSISILLLHFALSSMVIKYWVAYVLICSVGIYFHPYVVLSLTYGAGYILFTIDSRESRRLNIIRLLISGFILIAVLLPGYIIFGSDQQFNYDMMQFGGRFHVSLMRGLGWWTWPHSEFSPTFSLWEGVCLSSFFIGLLSVIRSTNTDRNQFMALLVSIFLQVLGIILADIIKSYFFAARQIVHLVSYMLIFSAVGVHKANQTLKPHIDQLLTAVPGKVMSSFITIIILISALPRLQEYYHYVKGDGRLITEAIIKYHQDEAPIFVNPGYELRIYRLYLQLNEYSRSDLIPNLQPTSLADLTKITADINGKQYLITRSYLNENDINTISILGFTKLFDSGLLLKSGSQGRHIRAIYIKDE